MKNSKTKKLIDIFVKNVTNQKINKRNNMVSKP